MVRANFLGIFWADGMTLSERLEEINKGLKLTAIRQRGSRLSIRGTFPPKPGDGSKAKSYEIATGKPANAAGLKQAAAIAQEIESLLIRDKFDWAAYLKGNQKPAQTVGEWLIKLEAHHWSHTPKDSSKLNSWHKDYELKFNHLPQDELLSLELLQQIAVQRSKPGTRSRQGYAMAFRVLAEFAGIPDAKTLNELGKGYSTGTVNPRELPSDDAIALARCKFERGGWLWIYDALAVYGLRPHEIFKALTDRISYDPPLLDVPEGTKTGAHTAFPIPADNWEIDIQTYALPAVRVEGRNNNQLGMVISQKFRQLDVGFAAYDLRHCYARRGFEFGFPPDFLARSMGHSLEVHLSTYRAWWGEQPYLRVYREVMSKRAASQATFAHREEEK
jgi:HPt (histidine-containing phosphotransfer) domain-containing protein